MLAKWPYDAKRLPFPVLGLFRTGSEEIIWTREGGSYGSLDKLHHEELNNLFSSLNIITNKKINEHELSRTCSTHEIY